VRAPSEPTTRGSARRAAASRPSGYTRATATGVTPGSRVTREEGECVVMVAGGLDRLSAAYAASVATKDSATSDAAPPELLTAITIRTPMADAT
jgi:hypothetical protein